MRLWHQVQERAILVEELISDAEAVCRRLYNTLVGIQMVVIEDWFRRTVEME
ncbi:hypothetical protein CRG98_048368 [Punica granatum]|uniref:Uncharacterized protein n=1 Tax=Punica granatum TaxID=22663 RepID=A0A2I0HIB4_PUNGR|nr:hypothetical protein CRG98_048368 [Punica granatum]